MNKLVFLFLLCGFTFTACQKEDNPSSGTLVYDGRTYKTVIINGKEWMAENLAYLPAVSLFFH